MQRVKPTPGRAPGSRDETAEAELETSIPGPAQDGAAGTADRGREEESAVGHNFLCQVPFCIYECTEQMQNQLIFRLRLALQLQVTSYQLHLTHDTGGHVL